MSGKVTTKSALRPRPVHEKLARRAPLMGVPSDWTAEQVRAYVALFDELVAAPRAP